MFLMNNALFYSFNNSFKCTAKILIQRIYSLKKIQNYSFKEFINSKKIQNYSFKEFIHSKNPELFIQRKYSFK